MSVLFEMDANTTQSLDGHSGEVQRGQGEPALVALLKYRLLAVRDNGARTSLHEWRELEWGDRRLSVEVRRYI